MKLKYRMSNETTLIMFVSSERKSWVVSAFMTFGTVFHVIYANNLKVVQIFTLFT